MTKSASIHSLGLHELEQKLAQVQKEAFEVAMRKQVNPMRDNQHLKKLRRHIAQLKTVMTARTKTESVS
jgi:ribosomal protein L29